MKPKSLFLLSRRTAILGYATAGIFLNAGASAQTWSPTAGGDYNTATNWVGGVVPNAQGATAIINTNITAASTITFTGGNRTVGILQIGDTNNSNGFTFGTTAGSTLILDNGASTAEIQSLSGSTAQTIAAPLRLDSASVKISNLAAITTGTARTLTLSGAITAGNAGTKTLELFTDIASSGINLSGVVSNGPGVIALNKTGSGTLTLSGNNSSMGGGVTLNAGTLNINNANALGSGTFTINGGNIGNTSGTASLTINNAINWAGDFGYTGNQTLVLSGALAMTGDRSIALNGPGTAAVGTLTLNGAITDGADTFSLTTTSSGPGIGTVLRVAGTNTYGGTTTINGGLVRFINAASLPSNGANSLVIGDNGAVSVAGAFTTALAPILADERLSGASTGALALQVDSDVNFDASAKFQTLSLGADVGSSPVTYTGTITPGSSGYFIGGGGGTITFGNDNAFSGGNTVTVGNGGGGKVILNSANDYSGATTVKGGTTLIVQHSGALGSDAAGITVERGGGVELRGGITIAGESLSFLGTGSTATVNSVIAGLSSTSGDNEWTGAVSINTTSDNARINVNSGGSIKVSGNITTTGANAVVLTGGGNGTVSGNITGTSALIQNGGSTWVLSGTNTYAGSTRIDNGTVSVASISQQLGSTTTSSISLGEGGGTGRLLYTGASNETTSRGIVLRSDTTGGGIIEQSGSGHLRINGGVTGNSTTGAKTLTLQGSTSGTGELAGTIADTAGTGVTHIAKAGTGTWTISGAAKTYEGSTTVTGGVLNVTTGLTNSSSISATGGTFVIGADNVVKNDASVTLGAEGVLRIAGFTDSMGVLSVSGAGILDLLGDNNNLTFTSGTISLGGALNILNWNGNTAGGGSEKLVFTGGLSGSLSDVTFTNPDGLAAGLYSAKFVGTELVPDALIPEPSASLLLLSGMAGLLVRRRR
ncbi:MAG: autotransporter-associated beta strand repeat-containing protein [Akkermansiaceae bacterium]|nr:autotransporter-associated beta strand repeat-containing protein [Akkermansiaceae bacterium]